MDVYCIELFCDDRDFELKPWDQNGGFIYEEDKIILRTMWKYHNEAHQEPDNSLSKKKGKSVTKNNDAEIRSKLTSLGYGVPRKKKK